MAPSARRVHRRNPLVTALFSALTLALLIVPVTAAQAHDVLEGTNPANGSTVATVPDEIQMTYNNTPMAIGSEILIQDSSGTNWATGPVTIVDNHVTQALKPGAPAGAYTVNWRIVSSDSHPIEGSFSFTATKSADSASTSNETGPAPSTAVATAAGNDAGTPWGIIGGAAVVLLVVVALVVLARRRLKQSDEA